MSEQTGAAVAWHPAYYVTTKVNDQTVGEFMAPIPDPFVNTTVTVGWRDLLRALITRRVLTVTCLVGGDKRTIDRVLELDPDHLGDSNSPSRKAWNAHINELLGDFDGPGDSDA